MNLGKEQVGDILVLRIKEPRLDATISPDLKAQLLMAVHEGNHNIVVDLTQVEYADSSGLGALLFGQRQAREAGGALRIFGARGRTANLIRIARLDNVLVNYGSEEEAIASFGSGPASQVE
ncbi:MAG: STAS domain-containing protein [candidate division KSB1 bacterium]|nr:STAS domain-containing protein [candidate division KSB1 bacterium]